MARINQQTDVLLEIMHSMLKDFSALIDNLVKIRKKRKIDAKTIRSINFSNSDNISSLLKTLDHEKIGILVVSVMKLGEMQKKFPDFVTLNGKELEKFNKELKDVVKNMDNLVK